jgi:ADP-ribose pyrophosphatase
MLPLPGAPDRRREQPRIPEPDEPEGRIQPEPEAKYVEEDSVDRDRIPPDSRIIYRGLKIDLALRSIKLSDGSMAEREYVLHRGAVALVPLLDGDRVCLVRNHRFAIDRTLLEVPAGSIDAGETPERTAERELLEETGYRTGRMTRLRDWYVTPGVMTERMFLFLCEDLTPGPTNHQPDETLESVVVPWSDAVAMVHDGRIEDAKSMLSILLVDRLLRERR